MSSASLITNALLAYSIHEHQERHVHRVDLTIDGDRLIVQDDGRGMGLDRPGYVVGLLGTVNGGTGWVQLHGVGLSLIASLSTRLTIESIRPTGAWRQSFSFGIPDAEPVPCQSDRERGTRWEVTLPARPAAADIAAIRSQQRRWASSHPNCKVELHLPA